MYELYCKNDDCPSKISCKRYLGYIKCVALKLNTSKIPTYPVDGSWCMMYISDKIKEENDDE